MDPVIDGGRYDDPVDLVAAAYAAQFGEFGVSPAGVLWSSAAVQKAHFAELCKVIPAGSGPVSVNDLGCGYGAFFEFLKEDTAHLVSSYHGYDICEQLLEAARARIGDRSARFSLAAQALEPADYSFASGTFNLKTIADDMEWRDYVRESLLALWDNSRKGLAFNLLDGTASARREPWLYYTDADAMTEFCRSAMSADVVRADGPREIHCTLLVRR